MSYDTDQARFIDRIQASAFYQAKIAGATFISIPWVAKKLKRSKNWVKTNWKKDPWECGKWKIGYGKFGYGVIELGI